jgi:putative NIF3 family GTP cyclohydrolase 1 type 2
MVEKSLTTRVADEALSLPASMIITYHPPIFKPLSSLTLSNPIQASLLRCAAAGISVYSPHSALDSVYEGVNDWLASGLGSGRVDLIGDEHPCGRGGSGRLLKLDEKTTLSSLQERAKKHLGLTQRLYHTGSFSLYLIELRCSPYHAQYKWHQRQAAPIMRFIQWQSVLGQEVPCCSEWTLMSISLEKCRM